MKALVFLLLLFSLQQTVGQSCSMCKRTPKICHYDFFVLENKPEDPAKIAEWRQLFWLASFSQDYIFNHNKNCVRFIDPVVTRATGYQTLVVGLTEPVLPPSKVPSSVDYIIMGGVIRRGDSYLLQIQLQTACTQQTVAKSEVTFHASADPEYIKSIAEEAAAKISPLEEKINTYANKKREEDKNTAFGSWGSQSIEVVPKKSKLASGQETDVEITLKDCDGTPLANREIRFDKSAIEGFEIKGTTGGTISPSSVKTDGNGKAKAKFKMGATKNAFIRAHYLFNRPSGCPDAMIGSCPIGGIPVEVTVFYETDQVQSFDQSMLTPIIQGGKTKQSFTRSHVTKMYFFPKDPKSPYLVLTVPEAKAGESIFEMDLGDFTYSGKFPAVNMVIESGPINLQQKLSRDSVVTNSGHTQKKRPSDITFFLVTEFEPMYFGIEFHCENEDDDNEIRTGPFPGGVTLTKNDYNTKFTIKKITDPQSPYKTDYMIEMLRDPGSLKEVSKDIGKDITGLQKLSGYTGTEVIAVFIRSPY